jgi:hypothetical protein
MEEKDKVRRFIIESNAFEVMGHFRKLKILDKTDIEKAMGMSREEWISFMFEKAGIPESEVDNE